jgi:GNAT superfamily N-acetyltransferase
MVNGFPLERFLPYEPAVAFPPSLLDRDGVDFFLLRRNAEPAGACLTVADDKVGGVYWVTTLPSHRSQGVGRALMHAVLNHFADRPVTLTASMAGRPLYDSMGFETVALATWWS